MVINIGFEFLSLKMNYFTSEILSEALLLSSMIFHGPLRFQYFINGSC